MPGVDFDRVRREITMEQVLDLLGFAPTSRSGVQWYGRCPLHGCLALLLLPLLLLGQQQFSFWRLCVADASYPDIETVSGDHGETRQAIAFNRESTSLDSMKPDGCPP